MKNEMFHDEAAREQGGTPRNAWFRRGMREPNISFAWGPSPNKLHPSPLEITPLAAIWQGKGPSADIA